MVEKILIRRIREDDGDKISQISAAITQAPVNINFSKIAAMEARKIEDASFVAVIDDEVVGYMISNIVSGLFGIERSAWITMLGVDPKHMDQGIGKRLAEEIFAFYLDKGINNIFTSVRWDSTDLLSFFKTLGFDRSSFTNLGRVLN